MDTMIIYSDRVEFKNPNIPHGRGPIDPTHFTPYPKNPTLCKFSIQLGRYEELGSGVNNVTKYLPFYAPGAGSPSFIRMICSRLSFLWPRFQEKSASQAGHQSRHQSGRQSRHQSGGSWVSFPRKVK